MYAAAGGASLAGRKARQHGRLPAPPSSRPHSPLHPAPSGVRLYSCAHWESRLLAPPAPPDLHSPCDVVECAAGRAAWQEAAALSIGGGGAGAGGAARRCSVLGDHPGARRDPRGKWIRNNRVRDASCGSSSESDGEAEGNSNEPWGVARLLYAGLGILALGLVVYFVGTGDKGFKTPALRLVGPSLIAVGLALCLLRITFCIFAKPCCRRRTNYKENRRLSGGAEGEELPLAGARGGGPAQCSPARRLDASSCDVSSLSSGEEDERLRRYRTTRTSQVTGTAYQSTSHSVPQQTPSPLSLQPVGSPQPSAGTSPRSPHSPCSIPGAQPSSLQGPHSSSSIPPRGQPSSLQGPHSSSSIPPRVQSSALQGLHSSSSISPGVQPSAVQGPLSPCSVQAGLLPGALQGPLSPCSIQPGVVPGASQGPHSQCSMPPGVLHSAIQGPQGPRRPPPRNVSFASGPDGELVLSPAQLRS